ncbi:hypothetical protein VYU27_009288 [Nannochloropsis oceanica]
MEQLEDNLSQARDAVALLLSSSCSSSTAAAKDANRLLREVERAVQYAQREAMGEPEARKTMILGRLQRVERAVRELKATVRQILKAAAEGTFQHSPAPSSAAEDRDFLLHHHHPNGSPRDSQRQMEGLVDVVGESREMTASLARTRKLMHQEVRRMGGVVEVIDEDGKAITATHQAHTAIAGALERADALLRRLKRQEQMDRWSKRASFAMFLLTVTFIASRRVWLPDVVRHYQAVRTRVLLPVAEKVWGGRGDEEGMGVGLGVVKSEKQKEEQQLQQQQLGKVVEVEDPPPASQQQHLEDEQEQQQQRLGRVVQTGENKREKVESYEKRRETTPRKSSEKAAVKEQGQEEVQAVPAPRPMVEDVMVEDGGLSITEKKEGGMRTRAEMLEEVQAHVAVVEAHGQQAVEIEEKEEEEEEEEEEGEVGEEGEEQVAHEEGENKELDDAEDQNKEETGFVSTMKRFEDKGNDLAKEEADHRYATAAEEEDGLYEEL